MPQVRPTAVPPASTRVLTAPAPGRDEDDLVAVRRWSGDRPTRRPGTVRTPHFDVTAVGGRVVVAHSLPPERLDDDLTGLVVGELFGPGWLRGAETLERVLTGVVALDGPAGRPTTTARPASHPALEAWEPFYRNTIAHRDRSARSAVDDRVCALVRPGPVLDLGCGFGFLSLRLADRGHEVTACDVATATVRRLRAVAPRLGTHLTTLLADAARVPLDDGCAETVLVVHLLEHLDDEHGAAVVQEALRCARRRVVVAAPLLDEPVEALGQVRTVTLDDLRAWGAGQRHVVRRRGAPRRVAGARPGLSLLRPDDGGGRQMTPILEAA